MRWPGIPPHLWGKLNELVDQTNVALSASSDGSLLTQSGDGGLCFGVPPGDKIYALITGGNNPYSWRLVNPASSGDDQVPTSSTGGLTGDQPSGPCAGTGTQRFRAAWERNGNTRVLPGTVVLLEPKFYDVTGNEDQEYVFDNTEHSIIAQLYTDQVPSTPLLASMPVGATTLKPTDYTQFPASNGFSVKIDNEYFFVSSGAGTSTWTVAPGYKTTTMATHATNANVTLAGARRWMEQEPVTFGRWESRPNGLSGDFILEPAYELGGSFETPNNAIAELRRRSTDVAGQTAVLGADLTSSGPTLTTSGPTTLPAYGPFSARIDDEYIYVSSVSGPTLNIVRGTFDTQGTQHAQGAGIRACASEWYYQWQSGAGVEGGGGSGASNPSLPSAPGSGTSGVGFWDPNCKVMYMKFVNGAFVTVTSTP